ncbi:ribonuclease III [Hyphococcus luteus]|uniref:Ribonuclease 3 n=1 Tax=Hyphococcus luteus TaxID=2058213 RepID=A0A2S7K1R6_9PROT|nr:ribonuclease III [Marinicaulis flavus]PQA86443.1 ribonuclease III [Marinicaulis flavus]
MTKPNFAELEKRIGHAFKDKSLLTRALTHSSLSGGERTVRDLERLEFLGDRVLGLLTAEELWRRYPHYEEGEMAPRLNALVRKETCAKAALHFGLDGFIMMSEWEAQSGGRKKKAILGDVMEALLGAIYIDGGLDAARGIFDQFWTPNLEDLSKVHKDPKTALQEWSQNRKLGTPDYDVVDAAGPAHAPDFKVAVRVKGLKPAHGEGRSKREAQMEAARALLVREGVWSEDDE